MFHAPTRYMVTHPLLGLGEGNNGFFKIPFENVLLFVQASDGMEWEHCSVSLNKNRCPTWEEMCFIKNLFWDAEDCVIQYHPRNSDYVNCMQYCLHLWRPIGKSIFTPPTIMVGPK